METSETPQTLYLITGHIAGRLTMAEQAELDHWLALSTANQKLFSELSGETYRSAQLADWNTVDTEAALSRVKAGRKKQTLVMRMMHQWKAVAAAIVIVCMVSVLLYRAEKPAPLTVEENLAVAATIQPGGNKAFLTLADGTRIDLDAAGNGQLAQQAGIRISKTADGRLYYETIPGQNVTSSLTNKVTTPKGGQYQVRLPDGTLVLLNAASTLTYPASFRSGKERRVELTGEAYFEVAPDKAKPFIVKTIRQEIAVLGTHFNISSYEDERQAVTTLVEGSVRVSAGSQQRVIRPGEQAISKGEKLSVQSADLELALAWKNDEILFKSASIKDILQQVARWYNLEVSYEGAPPADPLTGGISRKDNLDVLLRILKESGLRFSVEKDEERNKLTILGKGN